MKNLKEESLIDALSFCDLKVMPEKEDGENIWLRAIALVSKSDGSKSYVYVEKDPETMENIIKADFGNNCIIRQVDEYYPFSYLKDSFVHKFKTKKAEERIKFLSMQDKKTDFSKMTVEELDRENIKRSMAIQLNHEKLSIKRRHNG